MIGENATVNERNGLFYWESVFIQVLTVIHWGHGSTLVLTIVTLPLRSKMKPSACPEAIYKSQHAPAQAKAMRLTLMAPRRKAPLYSQNISRKTILSTYSKSYFRGS